MLKLMTVVGTRPEIIKLARVIPELDQHFAHILIHTGQNNKPELDTIFFKELKIRNPDMRLELHGDAARTPMQFIANVLLSMEAVIKEHAPDALLILGDTNSCVGAAYAAKRLHVPIFHMEAGNRCFDQRTPEETNRKLVDHLSDINMVYTEHARRNLLAEGVKPDTIVKTGSPMREVISWYNANIQASEILHRLDVKPVGYFVLSAHREENVDGIERLQGLVTAFGTLAQIYQLPVVLPLHPRTHSRLASFGTQIPAWVRVIEPVGFLDYAWLQSNALCVFSDSGTLTEEASMLGFPAVAIRQSHERPEGMDTGATIMCDPVHGDLRAAAEMAMNQPVGELPDDYAPTNIARKIARTILSYVDFVNRTVWRK